MRYENPIIRGFNPDPSICRAENGYYIATSTFEYFPAIAIYHSTDLVNWEHIGNCIERENQLPMETAYPSGGVWAPTIRYSGGRFYVTATFCGKGNFIVSADSPEGKWSDPVWVEMDGIDPSMFFEDGKMYYCANDCGSRQRKTEGISLAQVDVNTGKVIGEITRIWEGTGGGFLEAPHIYHIGEWYYLMAAEGGTGLNHMVTLARSRSIFGKYESCPQNPILTNRNDTSKQALCCGHADLVEDENANLWLVHLGTRPSNGFMSHLGRETFLTPAKIEDGWIKVCGDKKAKIICDAPVKNRQNLKHGLDFDFKNPQWEKQWMFLRRPDMKNYERGGGALLLKPSAIKITDAGSSPVFAAVRQPDFECETEVSFDFNANTLDDEAGAVVYLAPDFMYRICKRTDADGNFIEVKKTAFDFNETAYREKITDGKINIKIKADKEKYEFYYSVNDGSMKYACSASTRFLSCELAGKCFTGTVIGVYAQSESENPPHAVFYKFSQRH